MTNQTERLLEEALKLPAADRELLAESLFASLDDEPVDVAVEAAWTAEAKRRLEAARRDPSLLIDGEKVFDEAYTAIGVTRPK